MANAQKSKITSNIEKVSIMYQAKPVKARKLTVSSAIPMQMDDAWSNVKTPALLQFVAKGMIKFKPLKGGFPEEWVAGKTYETKMKIFGFIPFGGTHALFVEKVDNENYEIETREWDKRAKVWNHTITMKALDDSTVYYEDTIIIYGGAMTGVISSFAKRFYKHRQKRWQIVAREKLRFG
jgi:hypothetical protein